MSNLKINVSKYLLIILMIAFFTRLIPSKLTILVGNDAYVHKDIVIRLANEGLGILSWNLKSITGISQYGYPVLFHLLSLAIYKIFQTKLVFFLIPPVLSIFTIFIFYKMACEIFNNKKIGLASTFLFAFAPSYFVRTSIFIPESLGLFFFISILYLLVKYIKSIEGHENLKNFELRNFFKIFTGEKKFIVAAIALFILYVFTHRGWVFLLLTLLLLLLVFLLPSIKKEPKLLPIIVILLALFGFIFIKNAERLQTQTVAFLGFFKWLGAIQLVLGVYAIFKYFKSNNPIYKFIVLWAILFIFAGAYSFRFRDPYLAIPICILASPILLKFINTIKSFKINKKLKPFVLLLLLSIVVLQGVAVSYSSVAKPTERHLAAFNFIKDNTPKNSIFLASRDDAYLLVGETERKDIILQKSVYQGLFDKPPSLNEVRTVQNDVNEMLNSPLLNEVYFLLEKYNVTYIYLAKGTYNNSTLSKYMAFDPHFKPLFISRDAIVYQYVAEPKLTRKEKLNINEKSIKFIEEFWNGYSYSDTIGTSLYNDTLDIEFRDVFPGSPDLNAMISLLYNNLSEKYPELKTRSEYIIDWLACKQLDNGSFVGGTSPPEEYTLTTMSTIYPLLQFNSGNEKHKIIVKKGIEYVESQTSKDSIQVSNFYENSNDYLSLKTDSQVSGMYPKNKKGIIEKVISKQREDGSWYDETYKNIGILKGLCLYYNYTKDPRVLDSIKKGAKWLKSHQTNFGKFKDDGNPEYCISQYADACIVYHVAGDESSMKKTLNYIFSKKIEDDPTPLRSYLTLIYDLSMIYGNEKALNLAERII